MDVGRLMVGGGVSAGVAWEVQNLGAVDRSLVNASEGPHGMYLACSTIDFDTTYIVYHEVRRKEPKTRAFDASPCDADEEADLPCR